MYQKPYATKKETDLIRNFIAERKEFINVSKLEREAKVAYGTLRICKGRQKTLSPKVITRLLPILEKVFRFKISYSVSIQTIENEVCRYFNIKTPEQLKRKCRKRERFVLPRQIIMYLSRELTNLSQYKIAKYFNKDHATVIHACKTIQDLMDSDPLLKSQIEEIRKRIKNE